MTKAFADDASRRFGTRAVHAGQVPDPLAGAVMTPIYQTSTYVQEGLGRNKGYEYARTANPTREALERNIAALEGGRYGFPFAPGHAVLDPGPHVPSAGDHLAAGGEQYGGANRPAKLILGPAPEGPERPRRPGGRDGRGNAGRCGRAAGVDPDGVGAGAGAVGRLAGGARDEAPRPGAAPARRGRPPHRRVADAAPQGGAGLLPRPAVAPAARARLSPDDGLRRHDLAGAGLRHPRAGARRAHPDLQPR